MELPIKKMCISKINTKEKKNKTKSVKPKLLKTIDMNQF